MKYQSTTLATIPDKDAEREVRKADLDLLAKINGAYDELKALLNAQSAIPAGTVSQFAGSTAPTGYFICDGTAVSRTTYKALFDAIGTTWGSGDGSTTFNIPDLRAAALAGVGTSTGYTVNETITLASKLNDQMQGHSHGVTSYEWPSADTTTGGRVYYSRNSNAANGTQPVVPGISSITGDGTNGTPRIGTVTRGKRVGINHIIKY